MSYLLSTNTPPPIIIHLDSRYGTSVESVSRGSPPNPTPLTTNYIYVLKEPVIVPENMNLLLSLHSATIPYSFYNVREGLNTKIFFEVVIDGSTNADLFIELDEGNYSATSLASAVKNKIEAFEIGGISLSTRGLTLTITYSREVLKFKFSASYVAGSTKVSLFSYDFNIEQTNKANVLLGFGLNEIMTLNTGTIKTTINSVDINDSIHGLYVRTNLTSKSTLDTENGHFSNILARIPITTNAGGIIFHHASSSTHMSMIDVPMVQTLGIKLTDDKNQTIDLHSLHFQMSILLSFVHKENVRKLPTRTERRIMENAKLEQTPLNNGRKLKNKN